MSGVSSVAGAPPIATLAASCSFTPTCSSRTFGGAGWTPLRRGVEARIRLGGQTQLADAYADQQSIPAAESVLQDLRYAARTYRRSPALHRRRARDARPRHRRDDLDLQRGQLRSPEAAALREPRQAGGGQRRRRAGRREPARLRHLRGLPRPEPFLRTSRGRSLVADDAGDERGGASRRHARELEFLRHAGRASGARSHLPQRRRSSRSVSRPRIERWAVASPVQCRSVRDRSQAPHERPGIRGGWRDACGLRRGDLVPVLQTGGAVGRPWLRAIAAVRLPQLPAPQGFRAAASWRDPSAGH